MISIHQGIWPIDVAKTHHVFSPGLSVWLANYLPHTQPVYDFGCGKGQYIAMLEKLGFAVLGFEGTPEIHSIAESKNIQVQDISGLMTCQKKGSVICLEVMEHIDPEDESAVLRNIDLFCEKYLVLSWAIPGQPGHGHVNCRDQNDVIGLMRDRGYHFHLSKTIDARYDAAKDLKFFTYSLYIFERHGIHS